MKVTMEQTEKLLSENNLSFKSLGFSMLLTNIRAFHSISPTKYTLEDCNNDINGFLEKFKTVMEPDLEIIKAL